MYYVHTIHSMNRIVTIIHRLQTDISIVIRDVAGACGDKGFQVPTSLEKPTGSKYYVVANRHNWCLAFGFA